MSVIADFGVNGGNPSVVGGTGTAIKYFPRLLGTSIGVQSVAPSATSAVGQLVPPAFNELNGQLFRVRMAGDVLAFTGGTTYNVTLSANTGTAASPTYVVIASTGLITLASATKTIWSIDAVLFGTTNAGQVSGWYDSVTTIANGTGAFKAQSATGLDNVVAASGLNYNTGLTSSGNQGVPFGLVAAVTFATSLASNSASLYQFQVSTD